MSDSGRPENETPQTEIPEPEELLGLGQPIYNAIEIAEKSGLGVEEAKRLWRAMGFVVVPETQKFFTEADLDTLKELAGFMSDGFADFETVLGTTRTMSQNVGRIAETEVDAIRRSLTQSPKLAMDVLESKGDVAKEAFASLEHFLVYVWRRHLAQALQRAQVLEPQGSAVQMAVGFADLVAFSRISRHLDQDELEGLIERFEAVAQEAATAVGGRIVKTIGDEVMFVADEATDAAEMALAMVDACSGSESEVEIRVGAAIGELTSHHGDYFGPTVNLASRAARAARPNSVLVGDDFAKQLTDDFSVKPVPVRRLKGIGSPQLFVLRRGKQHGSEHVTT